MFLDWCLGLRKSALSMEGLVPYHWCQWENKALFLLLSVAETMSATVGGIVPQAPDKNKQRVASGPRVTVWRPPL